MQTNPVKDEQDQYIMDPIINCDVPLERAA